MKKFTLIEILVAVAIIGILVSLLAPSLGSARDKGRTAVCKSNLKQMGYALCMPMIMRGFLCLSTTIPGGLIYYMVVIIYLQLKKLTCPSSLLRAIGEMYLIS